MEFRLLMVVLPICFIYGTSEDEIASKVKNSYEGLYLSKYAQKEKRLPDIRLKSKESNFPEVEYPNSILDIYATPTFYHTSEYEIEEVISPKTGDEASNSFPIPKKLSENFKRKQRIKSINNVLTNMKTKNNYYEQNSDISTKTKESQKQPGISVVDQIRISKILNKQPWRNASRPRTEERTYVIPTKFTATTRPINRVTPPMSTTSTTSTPVGLHLHGKHDVLEKSYYDTTESTLKTTLQPIEETELQIEGSIIDILDDVITITEQFFNNTLTYISENFDKLSYEENQEIVKVVENLTAALEILDYLSGNIVSNWTVANVEDEPSVSKEIQTVRNINKENNGITLNNSFLITEESSNDNITDDYALLNNSISMIQNVEKALSEIECTLKSSKQNLKENSTEVRNVVNHLKNILEVYDNMIYEYDLLLLPQNTSDTQNNKDPLKFVEDNDSYCEINNATNDCLIKNNNTETEYETSSFSKDTSDLKCNAPSESSNELQPSIESLGQNVSHEAFQEFVTSQSDRPQLDYMQYPEENNSTLDDV